MLDCCQRGDSNMQASSIERFVILPLRHLDCTLEIGLCRYSVTVFQLIGFKGHFASG
jgi:hypothetical protein